jgi:predicted ester cyclase
MNTERNKSIVRKFNTDFLMEGNLEVFEAIVDPSFINHNFPADTDSRSITRDFIYHLHKALPDRKLTILDMFADGDKIITFKTVEGTLAAPFMGVDKPGNRLTLKIIDIVQLADEKYIAHWSARELIM